MGWRQRCWPPAPSSKTRSRSTSYNAPAYLESLFALKAGLATVNTNYRYMADELVYLWDNADVVAVAFHGARSPSVDELRSRLPRIHTWLWVDDGSGSFPSGRSTTRPPRHPRKPRSGRRRGRDGDHLLLLYTGGPGRVGRRDVAPARRPRGARRRQPQRLPPEQDLVAAAERATKPGPRTCPPHR